MTTTQAMYDVYRVSLTQVHPAALNVSREEALIQVSLILASYNDNWQIQPENPRGMVRVVNTISNDYQIVAMVETTDSINRREGNTTERTTPRWLVQTAHIKPSEYDRDYNADSMTPDASVIDWLDRADGRDIAQEAGV